MVPRVPLALAGRGRGGGAPTSCNPPSLPSPTGGERDATRRCGSSISTTRSIRPSATCSPRSTSAWASSSARFLGVPFEYARHLQKTYYRQFGTTLCGLMQVHRMDPKPFLDYVHDLDLSGLAAHPELAARIERLPGRKLIFTNGSRGHAERVAGKLGMLHLFEGIFDICDADYVPKPTAGCYEHFLKVHGVSAPLSAMFEDIPRNLEAPHALGMTTVLVHSANDYDHPVQQKIRSLG